MTTIALAPTSITADQYAATLGQPMHRTTRLLRQDCPGCGGLLRQTGFADWVKQHGIIVTLWSCTQAPFSCEASRLDTTFRLETAVYPHPEEPAAPALVPTVEPTAAWIATHRDCQHFDGTCRHDNVNFVPAAPATVTAPAISVSAEDRKAINTFARQVKGLPIFSHCQVAVRSFEGAEHANLAYFGITEPGSIGATDLADFGPRLADLRYIEGHPSEYVVADFYTYGRDRVGGDLQLDTNVQAVWFRGVLIALSEGRATVEWLVEPEPEPVIVSRHLYHEVGYTLLRIGTQYRVLISWLDGTDSSIGDWSNRYRARDEAQRFIDANAHCHPSPTEACGHFDVSRPCRAHLDCGHTAVPLADLSFRGFCPDCERVAEGVS